MMLIHFLSLSGRTKSDKNDPSSNALPKYYLKYWEIRQRMAAELHFDQYVIVCPYVNRELWKKLSQYINTVVEKACTQLH